MWSVTNKGEEVIQENIQLRLNFIEKANGLLETVATILHVFMCSGHVCANVNMINKSSVG